MTGVLDVRYSFLSDEAFETIADSLLARPDVFRVVDLGCNCLTDVTGVKLARLVVASTALRELRMDGNCFTQKTIVALCVALAENKTIELVDASNNQACDRRAIENVLASVTDSRAIIRYSASE